MRIDSEKRHAITVYYESTDIGGVSSVIAMVINGTAETYPTVLISRKSHSLQKWYEAFGARNVQVVTSALRNRLDLLGWLDVPHLFTSLKIIRRTKVLHCHLHTTFSCIPIIILAGIFTKAKIVVTEHYVTQLKFLRRRKLSLIASLVRETKIAVLLFLKRISFRFIDRIVTVSESNRVFMIETFGRRIESKLTVIANGIDTSRYTEDREVTADHDVNHRADSRTVVVVAGLNNQKGHEYLFHAIPIILRKIHDARFRLVGDGHLRSHLENLTETLGIKNSVEFMGFRADVVDIIRSSDLFVLPSIFEGMPLSVIEAMACGKAVVATGVDGTADVMVDNITGYLVPPKDPEQLAQRIIKLLESDELRTQFGAAGRKRACELFSTDRMVKDYKKLYDELFEDFISTRK